MPVISGQITTVTNSPTTVREIWVRAAATRASATGLTTAEPTRTQVSSGGQVRFECGLGAAVLVLVHRADTAGLGTMTETVPISVSANTTSLSAAVLAAQSIGEVEEAELHRVAAEIQHMLSQVQRHNSSVAADREAAARSATAAAASAGSALESKNAAEAAKTEARQHRDAAQASKDAAHASEVAAAGHESRSVASRSSATASAQAAGNSSAHAAGYRDAARGFSQSAASEATKAKSAADRAEQVVREGVPRQGVFLHHLSQEVLNKMTAVASERVAALVGGAPQAMDTLKELADAIQSGSTQMASIVRELGTKLSRSEADQRYATISALSGKAASVHSHTMQQVGGLMDALAGKVSTSDPRLSDAREPRPHNHSITSLLGVPGWVRSVSDQATPDSFMVRTGSGQSRVTSPSESQHIANKQYVDSAVAHKLNSSEVTSNVTGGKIPVRNSDGSISVPSTRSNNSGTVAASKDYVDAPTTQADHRNTYVSVVRRGAVVMFTSRTFGVVTGVNRNDILGFNLPSWARPASYVQFSPTNTTGEFFINPDGRIDHYGVRTSDIKFTVTYVAKE